MIQDKPGCGSVWLECLIWDQEVAGSNPVTPICDNSHINPCGCSSMVEHQPSKLDTWVRFPSPALFFNKAIQFKFSLTVRMPGCGSVWLECLIWDQEVAGSNPVTPICDNSHINPCGCSSMVEHQPSKLDTWVRFPSPALFFNKAIQFKFSLTVRMPGCGSVWLECLIWDQEVAGSNPVTPIKISYLYR